MIVSLLYLLASGLNIMFCVCLCARFQACLKKSYVSSIKRVFHYLHSTMYLGLWYPKGNELSFISYSDANFLNVKLIERVY
jgi:hypothetical protein